MLSLTLPLQLQWSHWLADRSPGSLQLHSAVGWLDFYIVHIGTEQFRDPRAPWKQATLATYPRTIMTYLVSLQQASIASLNVTLLLGLAGWTYGERSASLVALALPRQPADYQIDSANLKQMVPHSGHKGILCFCTQNGTQGANKTLQLPYLDRGLTLLRPQVEVQSCCVCALYGCAVTLLRSRSDFAH